MWTAKKPEMNSRRTLRASQRGSKNASTVGNGHHPEATPDAGDAGKPAACAGVRPRRRPAAPDDRATGQAGPGPGEVPSISYRSEEHTSELQSHVNLVCR